MAGPYPYELRTRVMAAMESGIKIVKISTIFRVSRNTIYKWKKIKARTGDVKASKGYQKGHSHIIKDEGRLSEFLKENDGKNLKELAAKWPEAVSASTIGRAIRKMRHTYKKNLLSSQKE